jgi:uncharacterized membrane protein YccC
MIVNTIIGCVVIAIVGFIWGLVTPTKWRRKS